MKIYRVGGSVRDELLHLPVKDKDYVVVGANAKQLLQQGFIPVGKDFPVFLHPQTKEEYALARTERKTTQGYHGFNFYTDTSVTLEEDLRRRDLTINALAMDEVTQQIIDPYGGREDLQNKLLRHISPAFAEDPVRILRIARFAARFAPLGFRIAEETKQLIREMVKNGEANALVAERVWQETEKTLGEQHAAIYFQVLDENQALKVIFPELYTLLHQNRMLGEQAYYALNHATLLTQDKAVRWAALLYNLHTLADSIQINKQLLQRLHIPKRYIKIAQYTVQYAHCFTQIMTLSANDILDCLLALDAFRKESYFLSYLQSCQANIAVQYDTQHAQQCSQHFIHCLDVAKQVSVKAILEQGYVGSEIRVQTNQQRIKNITQYITNMTKL